MTDSDAMLWTLIVGVGLLYCGHVLTKWFYSKAITILISHLHDAKLLDKEKVWNYLKKNGFAK